MIKYYIGDLLKIDADAIVHQVNCHGVMGAGIAWAIQRELEPRDYAEYVELCKCCGYNLVKLAHWQVLARKGSGRKDVRFVINLFCQDERLSQTGCITDYDAMRKGLTAIEDWCRRNEMSIAIPAKIGCGIAGGDQKIVADIISDVFQHSPVCCYVVTWERDIKTGVATREDWA